MIIIVIIRLGTERRSRGWGLRDREEMLMKGDISTCFKKFQLTIISNPDRQLHYKKKFTTALEKPLFFTSLLGR